MMHRLTARTALLPLAALVLAAALALTIAPDASASLRQLTRYPYLTDVVSAGSTYDATINWATDRSQAGAYATYGQTGTETDTTHRVTATKTSITVNGVAEYQWRASMSGLQPGTRYSYRLFFNSPVTDLLGSDSSPTFLTPPASGASTHFSFAVFGDWGATDSTGGNAYQSDLMHQVAASAASFALTLGDVAYPNGSQTNYGDLFQTGANISDVFAPSFYKDLGDGLPDFAAPGNHGFSSTYLNIWPQPTAPSLSGGRYQMDSYSVPGTSTASYPSIWYAFTVGDARFYVLTAAWSSSNLGGGTLYSDDYAAHWTATAAEYKWLANDLATHPTPLKFAAFHFPMYSDQGSDGTDAYLHGPGSLGALLTQYGVQFVFNGHAHIYERNLRQPGESFVSYVSGTGGAKLQATGQHGTSAFDAYGIGWNYSTNSGTATGTAPKPTSPAQVFSYLLVTVNGNTVTVSPTDSQGHTFDVMTYSF